jgi:hypothetical protein
MKWMDPDSGDIIDNGVRRKPLPLPRSLSEAATAAEDAAIAAFNKWLQDRITLVNPFEGAINGQAFEKKFNSLMEEYYNQLADADETQRAAELGLRFF